MKLSTYFLLTTLVVAAPVTVICQNDLSMIIGEHIAVVETEYEAVRGYVYDGTYYWINYQMAENCLGLNTL